IYTCPVLSGTVHGHICLFGKNGDVVVQNVNGLPGVLHLLVSTNRYNYTDQGRSDQTPQRNPGCQFYLVFYILYYHSEIVCLTFHSSGHDSGTNSSQGGCSPSGSGSRRRNPAR